MLLGINNQNVSANILNPILGDTPQPTPTYEPFYTTRTPVPYIDYTCPDHQPYGWLTVTPYPLWMQYCAKCVDQKYYDWGNNPYKTPEAPTPTPRVQPTIIPSTYSSDFTVKDRLENILYQDLEVLSGEGQQYGRSYDRADKMVFRWNADGQIDDRIFNIGFAAETLMSYNNQLNQVDRYKLYFTCLAEYCDFYNQDGSKEKRLTYGENWYIVMAAPASGVDVSGVIEYDIEIKTTAHNSQDLQLTSYCIYNDNWISSNFYVLWKLGESIFTPELTNDYCESVSGTTGGAGQFFSFNLLKGPPNCWVFDGINIDLSLANAIFGWIPEEIDIPGFQICLRALMFGDLELIGLDIDMDFIAFAMAGVLIFRMFMGLAGK